jgi:hypothetical protein
LKTHPLSQRVVYTASCVVRHCDCVPACLWQQWFAVGGQLRCRWQVSDAVAALLLLCCVQLGIRYTITTLSKLPAPATLSEQHLKEKVSWLGKQPCKCCCHTAPQAEGCGAG